MLDRQIGFGVAALALLLMLAAALAPTNAHADFVSVVLSTQDDVDNFSTPQITGNLTIEDDGSDPIVDLDGLSILTSIGGGLGIRNNPALTDIDGLGNLSSLGGSLGIENNAVLADLVGLRGVASSHVPRLIVRDNPSLTDVDGLTWVTSCAWVYITDNDALTDVDGLSGMTEVGKLLMVENNDSLADMDGLIGLTWVGHLVVADNASLANVDGLSRLTEVLSLTIDLNCALTNLDGLSRLTSIVNDLYVTDNVVLDRFCGLYPLMLAHATSTGGLGGSYYIYGNLANPTMKDILAGGPCDPADKIADLLDEGVINSGQAIALSRLLTRPPQAISAVLAGWVSAGILTVTQAQLLQATAGA